MTTFSEPDFPIAILGAGFSGLGTAIQLKKAGIDSFTIFERAADVGGTWRDNTYPGAACDVPSHAYSLSFEQSPTWSRRYAESGEIHEYLRSISKKWNLQGHMRFNTEIVNACFDEEAGSWTLTTGQDETFTARVVVSCVGGLVDPAIPDIKGIQSFTGKFFHTARWDHDYELRGRRVAVIGTGASAVQVIPSIVGKVEQLDVYQRTAAWVVPKNDKVYSSRFKRLLARFPILLRASRLIKYGLSELMGPIIFLDNQRLSSIGEKGSLRHLQQQVNDPELRKKLTPDFQFGCKRILISDEYWSCFEKPNVELVTDPIEEIKSTGILTKDGKFRPLDAIIVATGFDLGFASAPFPISGIGRRTLDEAWKDGAVAYKGLSVAEFPNWFILMGPNTGPGHTSILTYTEAQITHALSAIQKIKNERLRYLHVRGDVQDRYNEGIQGRMKHMVWTSGCQSWYLAGDNANRTLYPGYAAEYVLRTRRFQARDYQLVR
ncbi:MAG: NAD(P)/FAD-dependent oxidoreductase [Myxococcota bacterium]